MKSILIASILCKTDVVNQIECKIDDIDLDKYRVIKKSGEIATILSTTISQTNEACSKLTSLFLKPDLNSQSCTHFVEDEFFMDYRSYKDINCYLNQLSNDYKSMLALEKIGRSYEDRDLYLVNITLNNSSQNKSIFYFNGGLHAREWISPMSVMYIIKTLLYDSQKYLNFLSKYVIMFTPLSNPDGYEFSRSDKAHRMWRKNRNKNDGNYYGVDLNRNFDDHYGEVGFSTDPKDDTYQGKAPNSEPETRALVNNLLKYKSFLIGAIDFHSYGQSILRNYGFTIKASNNEEKLVQLSNHMKEQIKNNTGLDYYTDRAAGLYPAGGAFDDWMAEKLDIVSFTIELCPKKQNLEGYDFIYPKENIVTCSKSALYGAVSMMEYLDKSGKFPANKFTISNYFNSATILLLSTIL